MSKRLKIWLVLLLVGAGITAGGAGYMKYQEHKEREAMLEIVKSEEAHQIYKESFENLDKLALTSQGKIQSYEINEKKTKVNPMGGIDVYIIVNSDSSLNLYLTIAQNNEGDLTGEGSVLSSKLSDLVSEE